MHITSKKTEKYPFIRIHGCMKILKNGEKSINFPLGDKSILISKVPGKT